MLMDSGNLLIEITGRVEWGDWIGEVEYIL
jgi:hypothetical protein